MPYAATHWRHRVLARAAFLRRELKGQRSCRGAARPPGDRRRIVACFFDRYRAMLYIFDSFIFEPAFKPTHPTPPTPHDPLSAHMIGSRGSVERAPATRRGERHSRRRCDPDNAAHAHLPRHLCMLTRRADSLASRGTPMADTRSASFSVQVALTRAKQIATSSGAPS